MLQFSNPGERNILAAAACGVEDFIRHHGVDPKQIMLDLGFEEKLLEDPKVALDLGSYVAMMEMAADRTRNGNFGLKFGQQFTPERLGLIGLIAISSSNLATALENFTRLFPYHQQATETRLVADGDLMRLEYRILDGRVVDRRQDAELTMGMFVNIFRHCGGLHWAPEEIHFEHPRPEMWREHGQAFDAPVHFAQGTNAVVFNRRDLQMQMPGADMRRLAALSEELIDIAGGTGSIPLVDRLRSEIRRTLLDGGGTVESISQTLGIARWTLQRCLAVVGCNFSDLVDQVRRDLAERYLKQRNLPITEIAFMLGYSELSAFTRAFNRWWGISPQMFRRDFDTALANTH